MADRRAIDIQDVCPADTRFKVLVFTGDLRDPAQRARVEKFAAELGRKDGFFRAIGETKAESIYDVLSILKGKKEEGSHFDVPEILRSHWSKWEFLTRPRCSAAHIMILQSPSGRH